MTRKTNARIAGVTYLLYIAFAFPSMVVIDRATRGEGMVEKFARIAEHATDVRLAVVLSLLTCFTALALAVTLYRITRDEDRGLAMLALTCRVGEGVVSAAFVLATLGLLWLATTTGANAPDGEAAYVLGAFLLKVQVWNTNIGATFFAAGSTLFSYLLLRGRMIPVSLAWLGVGGSALLLLGLPPQLAGYLVGPVFELMWLPVGVFEVVLAPWLIFKGVTAPTTPGRSFFSN